MQNLLLVMIFLLGAVALLGAISKMGTGFSMANLRAVGLVLIGTFVTMLAIAVPESFNSAFGILAVIIGYLFGSKNDTKPGQSISGSNISNSNVAGRDINQMIDKLQTDVANINSMISEDQKKTVVFSEAMWKWKSSNPEDSELLEIFPHENMSTSNIDYARMLNQRFDKLLKNDDFVSSFNIVRQQASENGWKVTSIYAVDTMGHNDDGGLCFRLRLEKTDFVL